MGEDEPERAFQVSREAIVAAPCEVEFGGLIACQQDYPRLNDMDDLAKDPASACFLCCLMPRRPPQVTRPSGRRTGRSQKHRCKEYRRLPVLTRSAEPQTVVLLAPSHGAYDAGRLERGNASKTNRKSCVGTPLGPALWLRG